MIFIFRFITIPDGQVRKHNRDQAVRIYMRMAFASRSVRVNEIVSVLK
jgi:hypothetical protein